MMIVKRIISLIRHRQNVKRYHLWRLTIHARIILSSPLVILIYIFCCVLFRRFSFDIFQTDLFEWETSYEERYIVGNSIAFGMFGVDSL